VSPRLFSPPLNDHPTLLLEEIAFWTLSSFAFIRRERLLSFPSLFLILVVLFFLLFSTENLSELLHTSFFSLARVGERFPPPPPWLTEDVTWLPLGRAADVGTLTILFTARFFSPRLLLLLAFEELFPPPGGAARSSNNSSTSDRINLRTGPPERRVQVEDQAPFSPADIQASKICKSTSYFRSPSRALPSEVPCALFLSLETERMSPFKLSKFYHSPGFPPSNGNLPPHWEALSMDYPDPPPKE